MYPLKQKYAFACPIIDNQIKDSVVKFPQFTSPLFAMMVPCLRFTHKLSKAGLEYRDQQKIIKNFKFWLQTCAEENLIDILDVTDTLDLADARKLAAAMLDKKIREKTGKNRYYEKDIQYLKFRPLSFAKLFLTNFRPGQPTIKKKAKIEELKDNVDSPNLLALFKSFFVSNKECRDLIEVSNKPQWYSDYTMNKDEYLKCIGSAKLIFLHI